MDANDTVYVLCVQQLHEGCVVSQAGHISQQTLVATPLKVLPVQDMAVKYWVSETKTKYFFCKLGSYAGLYCFQLQVFQQLLITMINVHWKLYISLLKKCQFYFQKTFTPYFDTILTTNNVGQI